jgi:hypothetical protein
MGQIPEIGAAFSPFPFGIPLSGPVRGLKEEKRKQRKKIMVKTTEVIKLFCRRMCN